MQTQQEITSRKDVIAIAIIIEIAACTFVLFDSYLSIYLHIILITSLLLAFVAGMVGKERKIGFGTVFFISILLSPLVGFIFAFISPRLKDYEYNKKMREVSYNTSVADQLLKLNELKKEGIISDEEFQVQKHKLLNQ